jgi:uncharacterized membrane protein
MNKTHACQVCGKRQGDLIPGSMVREPIAELIRKEHPDWSSEGYICREDLNRYRAKYVQDVLATEKGDLTTIEEAVIKSLAEEELISRNVNTEFEGKLSMGQRVADKVAEFGGSWKFIIIFGVVLALWIAINSVVLVWKPKPFDPYPFILLNLILSCLAAIQAPVIMMSQNRQEAKDRLRAQHDYQINLKAELEIRNLHEKIDHLIFKQWQRLLEIQEIQLEIMEELTEKSGRVRGKSR